VITSAPHPAGALIVARELTRRFQRGTETVPALDRVSLALYGGELTVAAGPSGSGKTTLLSILAGIERPDSGQILTGPPLPEGVSPAQLSFTALAFVPQALALLEELTVAENVTLPVMLAAGTSRLAPSEQEITTQLLSELEIAHLAHRRPDQISGGEQQRVAVARALRTRPALLIADEPTGHQDRARVDVVIAALRRHAHRGAAVLISSHDPRVIDLADRVITLADGRIVADQRPALTQG
jgi:ABC-type lipoprotein export system ATPase subunit